MSEVLSVLNRMAEANGVAEVWGLATRHFASLGFSRVNYGLAVNRQHRAAVPPRDRLFLSTLGTDFARQYLDSGDYVHSPLYRWAEENEGACTWDWLYNALREGRLTDAEARSVRQYEAMGIIAGITISFPQHHARSKGALGLIGDEGLDQAAVTAIWRARADEIQAVAHMMHLCLSRHPVQAEDPLLTPRQREALEWVADGKTMQDVALLMGISPAMVEKHLRLAREALSVETTAQAIAQAAALNLLFPRSGLAGTYTKEVGNT